MTGQLIKKAVQQGRGERGRLRLSEDLAFFISASASALTFQ